MYLVVKQDSDKHYFLRVFSLEKKIRKAMETETVTIKKTKNGSKK